MKIKLNINKILFYISYTMLLFSTMFKQVKGIEQLSNIMITIAMIILLICTLYNLQKIKKRDLLIIYIAFGLSFITKIITKNNMIIILLLLIFSLKNIKFNDLLKYDIKIKILFLLIVVALYFGGFTNVNIHYRNGVMRHSMGFSNPNSFSTYIMSIVIEIMYLRNKKIGLIDLIYVILSIYIINYYASSRTQILCLIAFYLLFVLNKKNVKLIVKNKFLNLILNNMFWILTFVSILLIILYQQGNPTVIKLNTLLSKRIATSLAIFDNYDVNLFGNKLYLVTSMQSKLYNVKAVALDNAYIYLLLSYGIVQYFVIGLFIKKYMKYLTNNENNILKFILLVYLISGLMERFFMEYQYNIFLLYFAYLFYSKNRVKSKDDINE